MNIIERLFIRPGSSSIDSPWDRMQNWVRAVVSMLFVVVFGFLFTAPLHPWMP